MIVLSDFSRGKYRQKTKSDIYKTEENHFGVALDRLLSLGLLGEASDWQKHLTESKFGHEFINYIRVWHKKKQQRK